MKSLVGENDKRVRGYRWEFTDLDLKAAEFYYFCGVSENFVYSKNIHLAFREKKGSTIKIDNSLFSCEIENAEQLPINNQWINWKLPQAENRKFNTCRNWWFANMLASYYDHQRRNSQQQPENEPEKPSEIPTSLNAKPKPIQGSLF